MFEVIVLRRYRCRALFLSVSGRNQNNLDALCIPFFKQHKKQQQKLDPYNKHKMWDRDRFKVPFRISGVFPLTLLVK